MSLRKTRSESEDDSDSSESSNIDLLLSKKQKELPKERRKLIKSALNQSKNGTISKKKRVVERRDEIAGSSDEDLLPLRGLSSTKKTKVASLTKEMAKKIDGKNMPVFGSVAGIDCNGDQLWGFAAAATVTAKVAETASTTIPPAEEKNNNFIFVEKQSKTFEIDTNPSDLDIDEKKANGN